MVVLFILHFSNLLVRKSCGTVSKAPGMFWTLQSSRYVVAVVCSKQKPFCNASVSWVRRKVAMGNLILHLLCAFKPIMCLDFCGMLPIERCQSALICIERIAQLPNSWNVVAAYLELCTTGQDVKDDIPAH